jgi:hypothetical protein
LVTFSCHKSSFALQEFLLQSRAGVAIEKHPLRCNNCRARLVWRSRVLGRLLSNARTFTRARTNGGAKGAIWQITTAAPDNHHVYRGDVKSFRTSIGHLTLLNLGAPSVRSNLIMRTLAQYIRRAFTYVGTLREITYGISASCTLSPLIDAFRLRDSAAPHSHDPKLAFLYEQPSITTHDEKTHLLEACQSRFIACAQGDLD